MSTRKYIYYAVGEILLVMIGILLALQVNNWNQNRIDRNKEKNLVKSIYKELLENQTYLKSRLDYLNSRQNNGKELLGLFETKPKDVSSQELINHYQKLWTSPLYSPRTSNIMRIVSNEEYNLIAKDSLKLLLNEYVVSLDMTDEMDKANQLGSEEMKFIKQHVGAANFVKALPDNFRILDDEYKTSFIPDPQELLNNHIFEGHIVTRMAQIKFFNFRTQETLIWMDRVKSYIESHYKL